MGEVWTDKQRERSYSALCEALAEAGQSTESLFLARLSLLLAEALADPAAFDRCLHMAKQSSPVIAIADTR